MSFLLLIVILVISYDEVIVFREFNNVFSIEAMKAAWHQQCVRLLSCDCAAAGSKRLDGKLAKLWTLSSHAKNSGSKEHQRERQREYLWWLLANPGRRAFGPGWCRLWWGCGCRSRASRTGKRWFHWPHSHGCRLVGQEDLDGGRECTEKCVKERERENRGGRRGTERVRR